MGDLLEKAAEAHQAVQQAEALRTQLLTERRALVMAAHEAGRTHQEIGEFLGLCKQRVARIVSGNAPPKKPRGKRLVLPTPVDL